MQPNNIFITGGAGFIGSHIARYYAKKGCSVKVYDNLSRGKLLNKKINSEYNLKNLQQYKNITYVHGDITDNVKLDDSIKGYDTVFHMAAQTGVTSSMINPRIDFEINAVGTFNVLEACRKNNIGNIIYASTNKVFGNNTNILANIKERKDRWDIVRPMSGISETFSIDHCEHSPYGCSKLSGDLYAQDYGYLYGIKTGVFRMSCIYGTHQFGLEDQGWIAWLTIATLLNKQITIYGDGKQARDVLWVYDLIDAYDKFLNSSYKNKVYNIGGGKHAVLSIHQLLDKLKYLTGKSSNIKYAKWRPADQEIYFSDITKINKELSWSPIIGINKGLSLLIEWVKKNSKIF